MGFEHILGQPAALEALKRTLLSDHVGQAYRFEGPAGVGKELTAFAFARALLCEGPKERLGCDQCTACRRALTPAEDAPHLTQHPDLIVVGRGVYTPAQLGTTRSETTGISVEQIRRVVLPRLGYPPHEGRAVVFLVREAHELTLSAANALLKSLEEPPASTHFILVTSQPNQLLDTIRSRTLAVRFGPLPEAVVRNILQQHGHPERVAAQAQGNAELALSLAEPQLFEQREHFIKACFEALRAPDLAIALRSLGSVPTDRTELKQSLRFLAQELAERAKANLDTDPRAALELAQGHQIVLESMGNLDKNAQPTLLLEAMLARLRRTSNLPT